MQGDDKQAISKIKGNNWSLIVSKQISGVYQAHLNGAHDKNFDYRVFVEKTVLIFRGQSLLVGGFSLYGNFDKEALGARDGQ